MSRTISGLAITLFSITFISCGNKHKPNFQPDLYADTLTIGSRTMTLRYFLGTTNHEDMSPTLPNKIPSNKKERMKVCITTQINAFESEVGHLLVLPTTHIWLESTWAPCGIPNGGGCYTTYNQQIWAIGGTSSEVPNYYHELYHHYLWLTTGNADTKHLNSKWDYIYTRQYYFNATLANQLEISSSSKAPCNCGSND